MLQMVQIFALKLGCPARGNLTLARGRIYVRINSPLDRTLGRIIYLLSRWQKDFYAIILIWIMRRANDNSGVKSKRARQVCNSGGRDHACRFALGFFGSGTAMKCSLQPGAGFARVTSGD